MYGDIDHRILWTSKRNKRSLTPTRALKKTRASLNGVRDDEIKRDYVNPEIVLRFRLI